MHAEHDLEILARSPAFSRLTEPARRDAAAPPHAVEGIVCRARLVGQLVDALLKLVDLAGQGRVEEQTVLDERIDQVRCRWCYRDDQIELVPRTDQPE